MKIKITQIEESETNHVQLFYLALVKMNFNDWSLEVISELGFRQISCYLIRTQNQGGFTL